MAGFCAAQACKILNTAVGVVLVLIVAGSMVDISDLHTAATKMRMVRDSRFVGEGLPAHPTREPEPAASDVAWRGGGVLGASADEVRAALDAAFLEGFKRWLAGLNGSTAAEAVRGLTNADRLAAVYVAMREVIAETPYGSDDCMMAATPVYVAQCLTSAVAVMSGTEAGLFAAAVNRTALVLPSVFRRVAAFRSTVCAQLCPCVVWAAGRVPEARSVQAAARPPAAIAKAAAPFLRHFGARAAEPVEIDALAQLRRGLFEAEYGELPPLVPAQPVMANGTDGTARTMHYDAGAETLVIRGPDGRNAQALPLPSAADIVALLTEASRVRGRDPARHGPRMPGLVAFSGNSIMRGLFNEVLALLRRGPRYYDTATGDPVEADPTNAPNIHSRNLYVRFRDVDVYISNLLGYLETTPETNNADVRAAYALEAEAMLAEVVAGAVAGNVTTTDVVRFLVETARPLAREFGSQPEGTLRFAARALRALCDAQAGLCPVLVLTYEFDFIAERPLVGHVPAEAAAAFLAMRSRMGIGHERLQDVPEHAPVEDLLPISVHVYNNGLQDTGSNVLRARHLTRFLLPARGLVPATAPIFVQQLTTALVKRNYAVPLGLDYIRAERAVRRGANGTGPTLASPRWSGLRRVRTVGSRRVEAAQIAAVDVAPAMHAARASMQRAQSPASLSPPASLPPQLLTLHLPHNDSEPRLPPLGAVAVTPATRDAVEAFLRVVRAGNMPHFSQIVYPDNQPTLVQRSLLVLNIFKLFGAYASALLGMPTTTATLPPPVMSASNWSNATAPPSSSPPQPAIAMREFADLAAVVGGDRLRADPALIAAVAANTYAYDAMLLQAIFPFSGSDTLHFNTMVLNQREASMSMCHHIRLGCVVGDCQRGGLGAVGSSQPVYALCNECAAREMGHAHAAFFQTTPPRPTVVEEDSEENAAAEAQVLAMALQENLPSPRANRTVSGAGGWAPMALAAVFVERFPVDMMVGSGCHRLMLGLARMLPGPKGAVDSLPGSATMAARINARLDRDGKAGAPRLVPQTPHCAHTLFFSHSIGGRNPLQRLELTLLLAHIADRL